MSLRQKTISGFLWSLTDNVINRIIQFAIGIILARLLLPADYGLVGLSLSVIVVLQVFVDSGFTQALIRKQDVTDRIYSTVFFFNLIVSVFLYISLYAFSGLISSFFNQGDLENIIKVTGISIILGAFSLVQRTRLTKELNFRIQTKISVVSSLTSGIFGIFLAYSGFGVWSLVWRSLLLSAIQNFLLWYFSRWKPLPVFETRTIKELFGFSSKLLLSTLLDTFYRQIYYFVIGKYFSAKELGFYTRAEQFKALFAENLSSAIRRVSYPVLSSIENEDVLRASYRKLLVSTAYISSVCMMGLAATASSLIYVLLGKKWMASVDYLQLLCVAGVFYPVHAINLNILNVKGRSDYFLRLEIYKKLLSAPAIVIGVCFGISAMLLAIIVNSIIAFFINSQYSGRLISYPTLEQLVDLMPSFLLAIVGAIPSFLISYLDGFDVIILLFVQLFVFFAFNVFLGEMFKLAGYTEIKIIIMNKIKSTH